ncbi:MAG: CotH kinase family protein [Myxococcales bacterium]|nr:CotH kinase family protein [Myxococcales bacterium]
MTPARISHLSSPTTTDTPANPGRAPSGVLKRQNACFREPNVCGPRICPRFGGLAANPHKKSGLGYRVAALFLLVGLAHCSDSQTQTPNQTNADTTEATGLDIVLVAFPETDSANEISDSNSGQTDTDTAAMMSRDSREEIQPFDVQITADNHGGMDTGPLEQDTASATDIVTDSIEPIDDVGPIPPPLHPRITEFLAKNDSTLADWEGDFSDWIEIWNPHNEPILLGGYRLTDDLDGTDPWIFPEITLEPGAYLVIFASAKSPPEGVKELHASFKLSGDGDTLALIAPNGEVVQHIKNFPIQLDDISYGHPTVIQSTPLVAEGNVGYYWVPSTSPAPSDWMMPTFVPPLPPWQTGALPFGMSNQESSVPPTVLADAQLDFSGNQGKGGWYYGYWDGGKDANGIYQPSEFIPFPNTEGPFGLSNYWTGSTWDWPNGNPPWTEISQTGGHPNGTTTGVWHWAIRRWISPAFGSYYISGAASNPSENGDGTICRILQNGQEIGAFHVDGTSIPYNLPIDLLVGDIIDFVIDPGPAKNDYNDGTSFSAKIHHPGSVPKVPPTSVLGTPVADTIADWSVTGTQGEKNWWYGYYNRGQDSDATYQSTDFITFPHSGGGYGPDNFWTSTEWDWFQGNPPWTYIGKTGTHPNSFNNKGGEQWTIRRYVAEIDGDLVIEWTLAKDNPNGAGVTGHIFHNGDQRDTATIPGAATGGIMRTVVLTGVHKGDLIDIAHDPLGIGGDPYDGWDGSNMTAKIWSVPNLSELAATDLSQDFVNGGTSVLVRIPFDVEDPSVFNHLMLHVQYDDGFAAYLNGHIVAQSNVPEDLSSQSAALSDHPFGEILFTQPIDADNALGFLNQGDNLLAFAILNATDDPTTIYLSAHLEGRTTSVDTLAATYLSKPTPGEENAPAITTLGPVIQKLTRDVLFEPTDPILVTTKLVPISAAVSTVTLHYRTMFDAEQSLQMTDDGQGTDAVANDGTYSATIPANTALPGQLVRWYVTATDELGNSSREPAFLDPTNSEEYVGGLANNPGVVSNLPVFYWFVQNLSAANSDAGTRGGLWYGKEYYDNIFFDLHGQSTKGFPKKSYNIDFNSTHRFSLSPDLKRMKDINWLTNYADKSKVRNTLSYETFAAVGSAWHLAFPIRVELNGNFFGLYDFVEDADNVWLERLGLDPDGALYKMYDTLSNVSAGEKKTRKQEDKSDLQALIDGAKLPADQ